MANPVDYRKRTYSLVRIIHHQCLVHHAHFISDQQSSGHWTRLTMRSMSVITIPTANLTSTCFHRRKHRNRGVSSRPLRRLRRHRPSLGVTPTAQFTRRTITRGACIRAKCLSFRKIVRRLMRCCLRGFDSSRITRILLHGDPELFVTDIRTFMHLCVILCSFVLMFSSC